MIYNEIDIYEFLNRYMGKDIIYVPNPGNVGDHVIAYSTMQIFDKIKLKYTVGDINGEYKNQVLFYGGGGNFIGIYDNCRNFMKRNYIENKIVILPHTIKDEDSILRELNNNVIIICREKVSYSYVYKLSKYKSNIYLSKDLALYLDVSKYKHIIGKGECNAFRIDKEKSSIKIPNNNIDLSLTLIDDKKDIKEMSIDMIKCISDYETINTNRLHIAIVSSLLGKKVNFYRNSYYKNKAVYEYSLIFFDKTKFIL
jgi:exopolysaccharide biosynthesis predicted pyruvyltransferase EpsI